MGRPPGRLPPEILRRSLVGFEPAKIPHRFTDVLIIGSGVAGLAAALAAAESRDTEVLILAKASRDESATRYAQGGIAAVIAPERTGDSVGAHVADTLATGQGLTREDVARVMANDGVTRMQELIAGGIQFDRDEAGELRFTLEGGHSFARILHRGDTTGQELERFLLAKAESFENITFLTHTFAVDLVTRDNEVAGAVLLRPDDDLEVAWAKRTILATGGAGRLFRETTNPAVATGDGVAMAFRAGAEIEDLEFVQFHPTTLYLAGAERFLITEAVRGEGGVLRDGAGTRFMPRFHEKAELAPRDVVSRGIVTVMAERSENKVFLDLSPIPEERIRERFPRIREILKGFDIDILRQPIPVRPSAHYAIGGVRTDLEGRTSVMGLLAAGEVAATRLHGANRLASNSLLEGLVFGHRAGKKAAAEAAGRAFPSPFAVHDAPPELQSPSEHVQLEDLERSLKSLLWQDVGLERTAAGLAAALEQIASWIPYGLEGHYRDTRSWTVQNMLVVAYLITLSAFNRKESRGVHYRGDFPARDDVNWSVHQTISREGLRRFLGRAP